VTAYSDWAWRTALSAVNSRQAVQDPYELAPFLDLIRGSKIIVELGTLHGGTFHALAWSADPEAVCITIDLATPIGQGGMERVSYDDMVSHLPPSLVVIQLLGSTHDPLTQRRLKTALGGRKIDALFIDADHHYHAVQQDHEDYAPLVQDGGIIGFHDIQRPSTHEDGCEVDQYWADIKPTLSEWYEYTTPGGRMGIGAYRVHTEDRSVLVCR
jgi:predicted O-methyltransferase YrrM